MNQFDKVINEGYSFDMGKYMDEGWKTFKKEAGSFIGFTLLFMLLIIIISVIPFVSIVSGIINYCFFAGFFIYIRKLESNKQEFGDFFQGFNFFGQIFLFRLIVFLFMVPLIILVFIFVFPFDALPELFEGTSDPQYFMESLMENLKGGTMFILSILIIIAIAIYITISYSLVIPLIVDAKLGFWEAMETSRKVVAKKFLNFMAFFILLYFIAVFGMIFTCFLGVLVIIPYFSAITYSMYDNILKPNHDDLSSQIAGFGQSSGDVNTESEDEKKIE